MRCNLTARKTWRNWHGYMMKGEIKDIFWSNWTDWFDWSKSDQNRSKSDQIEENNLNWRESDTMIKVSKIENDDVQTRNWKEILI
jgi:hypothetical protein